ncbi:MAG: DNA-3-methyladenine glycosylase [Actinomycetota bacterium]|jgi:DNA-3-methyladenine glycosylase II
MTEVHQELVAIDKAFAPVVEAIGPYKAKRRNPDGHFGALVRSIVYQQLAGAAAAAIHGRFRLLVDGKLTPEAVLAIPEEALAGAGLSRAKRASILDLATKVSDGSVPLQRISRLGDEEIIERLVTVRGIGRWTAEMFLLFQLGRMDVWPVDDLGVREGWRLIKGQLERPTPKELAAEGARYQPIRSVAAWYCWQAVHLDRERRASEPV